MESDNFSSRLREERTRLGLSQEALAQAGGVKKLAQHKYEKGENSPSAAYLQAIAVVGVDVGYLLTGQRSVAGVAPVAVPWAALHPADQALVQALIARLAAGHGG